MLDFKIHIHHNPWNQIIPNAELIRVVESIAKKRAEHVLAQYEAGNYSRDSLGLVILDPTAPTSVPTIQTWLATISIGTLGDDYVVNALGKAFYHRDYGQPAGYGVYVDLARSPDYTFCYGFSTQVDNTIAAASGQTELQDAMEAGHAAVSFNYYIRGYRQQWLNQHEEKPSWFTTDGQKPAVLVDLVKGLDHMYANIVF